MFISKAPLECQLCRPALRQRSSYQYNDNVYLEEHNDLTLLFETLTALDTHIKFIEKHTDKQSRIRSYERYSV